MKWRTGRKLKRTLYRQGGLEPRDDDEFLGLMESPELAEIVIEAVRRFDEEWKSPAIGDTWRDRETRELWRIEDCVHHGKYLCRRRGSHSWSDHMSRKSALDLNMHYEREGTRRG